MPLGSLSDRVNIQDLLVEHPGSPRRIYVSTLFVDLDSVWPDLDRLRKQGITIDSDYPFIGAKRGDRDKLIKGCDLFLGIYGFSTSGPDEAHQIEYRTARDHSRPVLAFIHSSYADSGTGLFDLLELHNDQQTQVILFESGENLTVRVTDEVARFFANGRRFEKVTDDKPPESSEQSLRTKVQRTGRVDEALRAYQEAIALSPDNVNARIGYAETLKDVRRFDDAVRAYQGVIEISPNNVDARIGYAETLKDVRRFDDAVRAYQEAIEVSPDNVDVRIGYAETLKDVRRFDDAVRAYQEAIEVSPGNVDARIGYAETLKDVRRFNEALEAYNEGAKIVPSDPITRIGRADLLRELRRFDEALQAYDQVIKEFPEQLAAHIGRAETLKAAGRFEEALEAYDWVIRRFPENAVAWNGRVGLLTDMGEVEASKTLQSNIEHHPTDDASKFSNEPKQRRPVSRRAKRARQRTYVGFSGTESPLNDGVVEPSSPKAPASIAERAAELQEALGQGVIDIPILLISLLDDETDRTAYAFLSSFKLGREKLLAEAKNYHKRGFPKLSAFHEVADFGDSFAFAPDAAETFKVASLIAAERKTNDVTSRDLFHALMRTSYAGGWLETTLGKDVIGWIRKTLDEWDDSTAIRQASVQEKMVEQDLFLNPPTQRDTAAERDLLGFDEYADALVQIIRRSETQPPLVIGVYGPWGSGKSTFMRLVKERLDAVGETADTAAGKKAYFRKQFKRLLGKRETTLRVTTVDYDAWAYADAQKLWSGLVEKIANELDAELTVRDRIAYLVNSHSRRLLVAIALGLIPVVLFALGYGAEHAPQWLFNLLGRVNAPSWLRIPGWVTAGVWAVYAYFLQKRPVSDAVAALAARFDSTQTAGLVSRIQDEFKTALQAKVDPQKKSKSVEAMRTDIRQRVLRNELKIVVFIDELDRCPLEKIVEILEAIKLFLAEDIFIVLLGVDTRVAAEAIRLHYKEVQNPNLPREYLEKIVQLPLRVPTARKSYIENYLQSFMTLPEEEDHVWEQKTVNTVPSIDASRAPTAKVTRNVDRPVAARSGNTGVQVVQTESVRSTAQQSFDTDSSSAFYDLAALSRSPSLPQMPDTKTEFEVMSAIARDFLESNPRRIKRLLNTYRYVKILAARSGTQVHTNEWQQRMLYWLAFTMKWPAFMSARIEAAAIGPAADSAENFLLAGLKSGQSHAQPDKQFITKYLQLTARQVLEYRELAANFLIENPVLDPEVRMANATRERSDTKRAGKPGRSSGKNTTEN
jgi:tetratricopeptide (TPR) repeat protein